jgi:hypothetical protein
MAFTAREHQPVNHISVLPLSFGHDQIQPECKRA